MSQPRDPERLAETPSPLGKLMASAVRDEPSAQQLADLAQRLAVAFEPGPASPTTRGSSLMAKLGVAGGLAALLAGGALVAYRSARQPARIAQGSALTSARVSEPASSAATPVTPALADAVVPQRADPPASSLGRDAALPPPAKSRIESAGPTPSAAQSLSNLEAPSEARLLEQARKLLGTAPAAALSLTDQHAARFPHGVLVQEREVIAVEALRRLHRTAEADRRAAAFAQAFPGSAHRRMVEDGSSK
jgi:hypothetical protein